MMRGLQVNEETAGISGGIWSADADRRHEGIDVRTLQDDGRSLLLELRHFLKGDALRGLGEGEDLTRTLGRDEAFRQQLEHPRGDADAGDRDEEYDDAMP